jgi:pectate lyase
MSLSAPLPKRTKPRFSLLWLFALCITNVGLWLWGGQATEAAIYQGFGATTPGGAKGMVVHVTNLNDSGPGSLRAAVSQGKRTIVFDVGGTIVLASMIPAKGSFITIDGFSAPPPGITLVNAGLKITGTSNAHDVIVRGLRIRNSTSDGITIRDGAYNIVIDHVSIQGASDGSIDITQGAFDVTVQWSILAENAPNHNLLVLVDYQALRVTFHHNLFGRGRDRNPHSGWDGTLATTPPDIVTDIRNNLIWDFANDGTQILNNTRSNVVKNFYYSSVQPSAGRALWVKFGGKVYAQGNYSLNGANVDSQGNQGQPFLASPLDTTDACTAARQVVAAAGVRPLDVIDQQYLSMITLPASSCP